MAERMTPHNCVGDNDLVSKYTSLGVVMHTQHGHDVVQAQIIVVGGTEGEHAHYMGCFPSVKGEPWQTTQIRWDEFARRMYAVGVEPVTDAPWYTVVAGEVTYDHYVLHEIQDDYRLDTDD